MSSIVKKAVVRNTEPLLVGAPAAGAAGAAHSAGQVRLLEQTPSGALIEVRCGCGKMIKVNCLYSAPGAAEILQQQGE